MLSFKEYLTELVYSDITPGKNKWKTVKGSNWPKHDKNRDLSDELFDLIDKSYKPIGGHIDFKKASDLPADHPNWEMIDIDADPEPDIVMVSKTNKHGKKDTLSATDGTSAAKTLIMKRRAKDLNQIGNYAEVSDAVAHILIKRYKIPYVDNAEDVQKVLGSSKKIQWVGEHPSGKYPTHHGWYNRILGGSNHMKIMVGKPKV